MSSPWATIHKPEVNLLDVVSEQLAADIAKKEEQKLKSENLARETEYEAWTGNAGFIDKNNLPEEVRDIVEANEMIETDAEIARTLQAQFDREHDDDLRRCQNKYNGGSKVSVSFKNYMRSNEDYYNDEVQEVPEPRDVDRFETMDKEIGSMPLCGYKMVDGEMVTKHDPTINGRNNARKLLSFPPEFQTGDGEDFDLQLSNQVYNKLKLHSHNSQHSRRHKIRDKKEDKATCMFGLDEKNFLHLFKVVNNLKLLQDVGGIISIGKEAAVFHAFGNPDEEEIPKECAIKVFKSTLSEYKDREKYIKGDHRFKDRIGKQTAQQTVNIWAEKEMANLCRLKRVGIPCPEVVYLKECVLIISFIGENQVPAKKLKDAKLSAADYIVAYDQVTSMMQTIFKCANLIHADLSEYNILWFKGQCYIIDVSQSVEPSHENAFAFLYRDCENITTFFDRKSVPGVMTVNELFKSITGYNYEEKEQLLQLQVTTSKPKPHTIQKYQEEQDRFDSIWENLQDMAEKNTSLVEPPKA